MVNTEDSLQWWKDEAERRGKICIQLAEANDALTAENKMLREALRPFADCGAFFEHPMVCQSKDDKRLRWFQGTSLLSSYITNPIDKLKVGDFRKAVQAYLALKRDGR